MSRATFQCRVCDRIFSRQARLRCHKRSFQHYLIDDIILPRSLAFECLWCDFQSDSSLILATHTARNHSFKKSLSIFKSLPRFQCPFEKCKTIANSKDTMRSHFYQVHRSQEAFKTFLDKFYTKCIHCKTEIRNSNYKSHFHWCKSIERNWFVMWFFFFQYIFFSISFFCFILWGIHPLDVADFFLGSAFFDFLLFKFWILVFILYLLFSQIF